MKKTAHREKDPRVKCDRCGQWMRYAEPTEKTPRRRSRPPLDGECTVCTAPYDAKDLGTLIDSM